MFLSYIVIAGELKISLNYPNFASMKISSLKEIKDELKHSSQEEIIDYCLRLVKYKKDNKELLTYLMFESENDELYISDIKEEIDLLFSEVNKINMWVAKKNVRRILAKLKKYIRYTQKKEVEIEILLYFCQKLNRMPHVLQRNKVLRNTLHMQLSLVQKAINTLHPDLQQDYQEILSEFC
jgi:hypothetical protein